MKVGGDRNVFEKQGYPFTQLLSRGLA